MILKPTYDTWLSSVIARIAKSDKAGQLSIKGGLAKRKNFGKIELEWKIVDQGDKALGAFIPFCYLCQG